MRWLLALLLLTASAAAQTVYVAPSGTDTGNCQSDPCETMQYAAGQIDRIGTLQLADGSYDQTLDIAHFKMVAVNGNCTDPAMVVVNGNSGQTVFAGEDMSILTLQCVTINAPSGVAFYLRQFTIGDFYRIRWGEASIHVSVAEHSKCNCLGGDYMIGSATYHYALSDHSTISANCDITVSRGVRAYAFLWGAAYALVWAGGATVHGDLAAGLRYVLDNSELVIGAVVLPGSAAGNIVQHNSVIE